MLRRHPGARRPLGREAAGGLSVLDGARLPLEPARRRPRARQSGRRQHVGEGDRSPTTRAARCACSGSRARAPIWPRSRPPVSPACGSTSSCRSASATRWTTRRWSTTSCAAPCARPATAVDRDAAARVHPGRARRPHASRRGHRADLDARRARAGRGGVRRRGRLARLPAAGLRHVPAHRPAARGATPRRAPSCSSGTASSPGVDTARRATTRRSSSSRRAAQAIDRAANRPLRPGRPQGRGAAGGGERPPSCSSPFPRSAARCSPTRTASSSRSTAARGASRSPPRRGLRRSARSARRAPTT